MTDEELLARKKRLSAILLHRLNRHFYPLACRSFSLDALSIDQAFAGGAAGLSARERSMVVRMYVHFRLALAEMFLETDAESSSFLSLTLAGKLSLDVTGQFSKAFPHVRDGLSYFFSSTGKPEAGILPLVSLLSLETGLSLAPYVDFFRKETLSYIDRMQRDGTDFLAALSFCDPEYHAGDTRLPAFLCLALGEAEGRALAAQVFESAQMLGTLEQCLSPLYPLKLDGYTFHSIARELTSRGLETPARKKRWYPGTVESILTNEKYKGDALLQKRFTVNFLTKETKANEGEVPQYYVENNHEAIISPQVFDWVQEEIKRRREGRGRYSGVSIFSSKIKCGQCGGWYGAKVWHSTDKYRRTIYRCNDKFKSHCKTPHLTEDDIKEAFVRAVNQLIENKADVLDSITLLKERLTDTEDLEEERDRISTDLNLLADKIQQLIAENARVAQNQDDYDRNYNELVSRYEAAKTQYDKTCEAIQYRKARSRQMDSFIKELRNQDLIKEFDARLWGSLVDFITVYSKDDIRVTFKDGTEIRA